MQTMYNRPWPALASFECAQALCGLLALLAVGIPASAQVPPEPAFKLVLKGPADFPAGLPALVSLEVTNCGKAPASYWCGGPGRFPGAQEFSAALTNDKGEPLAAQLSNGQYTHGSGRNYPIGPGQTIVVPLTVGGPAAYIRAYKPGETVKPGDDEGMSPANLSALFNGKNRPLPAGAYRLRVQTKRITYLDGKQEHVLWPESASAEFRLVVREDAGLRLRYEKTLADEALRGNWCVIKLLPTAQAPAALQAVAAGLAADNLTTARYAAWTLEEIKPAAWPADLDDHLAPGLQKLCDRDLLGADLQSVEALLRLAEKRGSDRVLAALIAVAKSKANEYVRERVVRTLGLFRQPAAAEALRALAPTP